MGPFRKSLLLARDFKQTTQNRAHDIHTQNESLYDDNGATKYPTDGTASHFGRLIEALEIQAHPRRSHTRRDVIVDRISIDIYKQPVYNGRRPSCPSSSPRFVTLVILEGRSLSRPTPHREEEEAKGGREGAHSVSLSRSLSRSLSLSLSFSLSLSLVLTRTRRLCTQFLDGESIYSCCACAANIADNDELVSKAFQGRHGRAYLFSNVVNVTQGPIEERLLITGMHTVCDIQCSVCGSVLGWKYESAFEESQKYKEGKFILEKARVVLKRGGGGDGDGDGGATDTRVVGGSSHSDEESE